MSYSDTSVIMVLGQSGALHFVCFEDFALVNNSRKYLVRACAVNIIVEGGTQHP